MSTRPTARQIARQLLPKSVASFARRALEHVTYPSDLTAEEVDSFATVEPYTMTSPERVVGLVHAVEYLQANDISGAFVECGVWRGGSMMAVAGTLRRLGATRQLYLFDTFEGMPPPSTLNVRWTGESAAKLLKREPRTGRSIWCIADEADVRSNLASTGYDMACVHLIRGRVEETIPGQAPERIALLRLDTDWYESTRHELTHLYSRLVSGGVLIIDDYGAWEGARKAVDEFLAGVRPRPLLNRLDNTGRIAVKP